MGREPSADGSQWLSRKQNGAIPRPGWMPGAKCCPYCGCMAAITLIRGLACWLAKVQSKFVPTFAARASCAAVCFATLNVAAAETALASHARPRRVATGRRRRRSKLADASAASAGAPGASDEFFYSCASHPKSARLHHRFSLLELRCRSQSRLRRSPICSMARKSLRRARNARAQLSAASRRLRRNVPNAADDHTRRPRRAKSCHETLFRQTVRKI